jgi:hypothetical protein
MERLMAGIFSEQRWRPFKRYGSNYTAKKIAVGYEAFPKLKFWESLIESKESLDKVYSSRKLKAPCSKTQGAGK